MPEGKGRKRALRMILDALNQIFPIPLMQVVGIPLLLCYLLAYGLSSGLNYEKV